MYDFFADSSAIGEKEIIIRGSDLNHMKNVLRLQIGEQICIHEESTGKEYRCEIAGYEKYDIVTANILADVLIPLTPVICHQMKPGALYITSGILDVKEDVVVKAVKDAGLEILEVTHQGEWVSVTARKQA